jgi:hypothetical protein
LLKRAQDEPQVRAPPERRSVRHHARQPNFFENSVRGRDQGDGSPEPIAGPGLAGLDDMGDRATLVTPNGRGRRNRRTRRRHKMIETRREFAESRRVGRDRDDD